MSQTESEAPSGSVEAVKLVKATETDWEAKILAARKAADAALAQSRADASAAVAAARAAADRDRTSAVQMARLSADQEAAKIVAEGEVAARKDNSGRGRKPVDRKDEVLSAVLDGFADQ
jgi:vacuolar-type H+-ATPase subunit H